MKNLVASIMSKLQMNKSCDQCRLRKVKCVVRSPNVDGNPKTPTACVACVNRNDICIYSGFKRALKHKAPPGPTMSINTVHTNLYIDRILEFGAQEAVSFEQHTVIKAPDHRVPSCAMSFFSNNRINVLAERLGSQILRELVERLDHIMKTRICQKRRTVSTHNAFYTATPPEEDLALAMAESYVQAFFKHIHPIYPFLDKDVFYKNMFLLESMALDYNSDFVVLYRAVLALGCQFSDNGSFLAECGQAWDLFQAALSLLSDILQPPVSLFGLQAVTAMAIFAMGGCGLQLDEMFITEASRMAQTLRLHKPSSNDEGMLKAFWTVYSMEKISSFTEGTASLLADEDIGCAIPIVPESMFGEYSYFLSSIRLSRIASIAYSSLFSESAPLQPNESYINAIIHVRQLLENWRESIPSVFQPGSPHGLDLDATPSEKLAFLQTHFSYYNIVFAVEKAAMHIEKNKGEAFAKSQQALITAARNVVHLTKLIDIKPYTPIFIAGIMPLSALFILFDFIVHNRSHPETSENLACLDAAAAYFRLLDMASGGELPGEIISEFASIAMRYIGELQGWEPVIDLDGSTQAASDLSRLIGPDQSSGHCTSFGNLSHPTVDGAELPSGDAEKLRTIFGWVFPDWGEFH